MTLTSTLQTPKQGKSENLTFYHVSSDIDTLKSFFREGAKTVGRGIGGQQNGFFVWTTEKAAKNHIRFLNDDPFSNKILKNGEAIIIGVSIPKKNITYPFWQQDYERSEHLFDLCSFYADFLNKNAHTLNISFPQKDSLLGWDFKKITDISFDKKNDCFIFQGINTKGKKYAKHFSNASSWDAYDSIKWQILIDWLGQNSADFRKDYTSLMQQLITRKFGLGLKYTGEKNLPISMAKYIQVNTDGSLKERVLFDADKGSKQVCPFLTMTLTRTRK